VPSHVSRDNRALLPEVEVVEGVETLSDRGRYQVHASTVNIGKGNVELYSEDFRKCL